MMIDWYYLGIKAYAKVGIDPERKKNEIIQSKLLPTSLEIM